MLFSLAIGCDNAAFENPEREIARILRALAEKIENQGLTPNERVSIFDLNGNRVGFSEFEIADIRELE